MSCLRLVWRSPAGSKPLRHATLPACSCRLLGPVLADVADDVPRPAGRSALGRTTFIRWRLSCVSAGCGVCSAARRFRCDLPIDAVVERQLRLQLGIGRAGATTGRPETAHFGLLGLEVGRGAGLGPLVALLQGQADLRESACSGTGRSRPGGRPPRGPAASCRRSRTSGIARARRAATWLKSGAMFTQWISGKATLPQAPSGRHLAAVFQHHLVVQFAGGGLDQRNPHGRAGRSSRAPRSA